MKWTDPIAVRRLEARVASVERLQILAQNTRARMEALGIDVVRIPDAKVLLPLVEGATLEDDENHQRLWANLLASAASNDDPVERQYVSILADLSPADALALAHYYKEWTSMDHEPSPDGYMVYGPGIDGDVYGYPVSRSLVRLGLVEPAWVEFLTYDPGGQDRYGDYGPTQEPLRSQRRLGIRGVDDVWNRLL